MKNFQRCREVATKSACPEKGITLFHVTHPKAASALLGPFLSLEDAELGRVAMRSPDAAVTTSEHTTLSTYTRSRAEANGNTIGAFAERMEGCLNA